MRWMVVLVCASVVGLVVGLVVVVARVRRNRRALQQMRALLTAGHHQQVLEHALPAKPLQDLARSLQVTSAVFTGRFLLALDLLAASTDDGTVAQTTGSAASAARLRAVSLLGRGRYAGCGPRPPSRSVTTTAPRRSSPTRVPTPSRRPAG